MALAQPFSTTSPNNLSVSFVEFASGNGYVKFYGGTDQNGYVLNSTTFYSGTTKSHTTDTAAIATKQLDLDFDILFNNRSQTIEGKGILNAGVGMSTPGGAAETMQSYLVVKIRKWDGTTETEIASGQGPTWSNAEAAVRQRQAMLIAGVDIPKTHFAIGETLRVTVELWAWSSQGTNKTFVLTHSPKNRSSNVTDTGGWDFGSDPTTMEIYIPFKLEE